MVHVWPPRNLLHRLLHFARGRGLSGGAYHAIVLGQRAISGTLCQSAIRGDNVLEAPCVMIEFQGNCIVLSIEMWLFDRATVPFSLNARDVKQEFSRGHHHWLSFSTCIEPF